MGRGKKRKSYYSDFKDAKRWKGVLSVGMKGFLCTCNMRMKECVREAYNLLNDYAEKSIVLEKEEVAGESIEDELDRELKDMRKKPTEKMFQVVDTGADNTVFIRTTIDDPAKLANDILSDIFNSKQNRSRFLLRMIPVDVTCKAYMDDIRKAADQMFDEPFRCDPLTFNVAYKARYNSSLLRDEVLSAIVTLVRDRNPSHKVDLTTPKKTVIVEVIKGVCCLSVVTDFYKHRKYNLLEAAKGENVLANNNGGSTKPAAADEASSLKDPVSKPEQNEENRRAVEVDSELNNGSPKEETDSGTSRSIEATEPNDETMKESSQEDDPEVVI